MEARHVQPRKSHVGRTDLQRGDIVAKGTEEHRNDGQEHHDRAVHRTKGIVEVAAHDPSLGHVFTQDLFQERPHQWDGFAGMSQLEAHRQHQEEAEKQEKQRRHSVLDADDLVVGAEDVLAEETRLMMRVTVRRVGRARVGVGCGGLHRLEYQALSPGRLNRR